MADYAIGFGVPETQEAICLNCKHPFNKHEGWSQHGSSLRCPVIMADILVGFSDTQRWSFGNLRLREEGSTLTPVIAILTVFSVGAALIAQSGLLHAVLARLAQVQ